MVFLMSITIIIANFYNPFPMPKLLLCFFVVLSLVPHAHANDLTDTPKPYLLNLLSELAIHRMSLLDPIIESVVHEEPPEVIINDTPIIDETSTHQESLYEELLSKGNLSEELDKEILSEESSKKEPLDEEQALTHIEQTTIETPALDLSAIEASPHELALTQVLLEICSPRLSDDQQDSLKRSYQHHLQLLMPTLDTQLAMAHMNQQAQYRAILEDTRQWTLDYPDQENQALCEEFAQSTF